MQSDAPIYVAGHRGMVGSAIWRELQRRGFTQPAGPDPRRTGPAGRRGRARAFFSARSRNMFSWRRRGSAAFWPTTPSRRSFFYENLQIQNNLIHHAHLAGVKKLLFLGSSCIYPKTGAPAAEGGIPADRPAGTDQPMVCRRQNRRHQAVPGLSPPIRVRLHQRHADEPVRAERPLRPPELACPARAHPQVSRSQDCRRRRPSPAGERARRCGNFFSPTTWPRAASS